MRYVITDGETPTGKKFQLLAGYDTPRTGADIVCRRLEWLADGEVGPISVPLKVTAPVGQLFYELTRKGEVSEKTRKASFAT